MKFEKALLELKAGAKMKRPSWGGYWEWEDEKKTILMRTKNDETLDIRETQDVAYTLENILADDWIHADETNTPLLGGVAMFDFGRALEYLKRGEKVIRKGWDDTLKYVQLIANEIEVVPLCGLPERKMELYFCAENVNGDMTEWLPSINDCLAKDWTFANQEREVKK